MSKAELELASHKNNEIKEMSKSKYKAIRSDVNSQDSLDDEEDKPSY